MTMEREGGISALSKGVGCKGETNLLLSMLMSQSRRPKEMERLEGGGLIHMSMASHVRRSMRARLRCVRREAGG